MFKFGDKVFCRGLFGNGIYHKCSYHEQEEPMCYVLFENYGLKVVKLSSITKVSDWIPCSERMPDSYIDVVFVDKYGKQFFGYFNNNDVIMSHDGLTEKEAYAWQYKQESLK